jgi:predicted metalloprotease with PDZ domain
MWPVLLAAQAALPTTYELAFSRTQPRLVHVTAEFTVSDTLLAMVPYGAEHLSDGWRTFVSNERLTGASTSLRLERRPGRKWRIWAEAGQRVKLDYDVAIEHDLKPWIPNAREAAYVRPWGVFAVGRALFVYHNPEDTALVIRIAAPDGWKPTTAWTQIAANTYSVNSWSDVINSVVFVGDAKTFTVREGPIAVDYTLGGATFATSAAVLEPATHRILAHYLRLFGGAPAAGMFVVINPDSSVHGGGGGVFRRSISMTFDAAPSATNIGSWGHTLAHEFFHIWNASAMPPASEAEEWIVEGIADYYAVLGMTRLGYFTLNGWLSKAQVWLSGYGAAAGQISLAQAGHQEWEGVGPSMLYSGGAVAALALDLSIRRATNSRRSLDDAMRHVFNLTRTSGGRVSNASFARAVRESTGFDATSFFEKYVHGKDTIAVRALLGDLGVVTASGRPARLIGQPSPSQRAARRAYFGAGAINLGGKTPAVDAPQSALLFSFDAAFSGTPASFELEVFKANGAVKSRLRSATGTVDSKRASVRGNEYHLIFELHGAVLTFDLHRAGQAFTGRWTIGSDKKGEIAGTTRAVHN